MGTPKPPERVTLIVGMISGKSGMFDSSEAELVRLFGPIDLRSPDFDFDCTDYYELDMGSGLKRRFISFQKKIDPGRLAGIKLKTNDLEKASASRNSSVKRPINLDPGYVSRSKLVLASTKNYWHRIYLDYGVYAEVTLVYRDKKLTPLETTYPDYRSEEYLDFFTLVHRRHAETLTS